MSPTSGYSSKGNPGQISALVNLVLEGSGGGISLLTDKTIIDSRKIENGTEPQKRND